ADGKSALVGGHDTLVRLWDVDSRREVRQFAGHTFVVKGVGFGRDDRTIFSAASDKTLRLADATSGAELNLVGELSSPSYALAVIPPGDAAAVASGAALSV